MRLFGIGGRELEAAGVSRIAGLDELSVMGGTEVVRRLPGFLRLQRRIERLFVTEDVRLLLPIDYPGLNLRLARSAAAAGTQGSSTTIAPQVWAWREGRARKLRRDCDRVLTVLPFEGPLLERYSVRTEFVGHPLLDAPRSPAAAARGRAAPRGLHDRFPEGDRTLPGIARAGGPLHAPGLRGGLRGNSPGDTGI